jgi:hypothetical protein
MNADQICGSSSWLPTVRVVAVAVAVTVTVAVAITVAVAVGVAVGSTIRVTTTAPTRGIARQGACHRQMLL